MQIQQHTSPGCMLFTSFFLQGSLHWEVGGRRSGHDTRLLFRAAAKAVLPELFEPRVPCVGVRVQLGEVVFKLSNGVGGQLDGESPVCCRLAAPHHTLLCSPSVAGHPDEAGVHASGRHQKLAGVFTASKQDDHLGVGLLLQSADHIIIALAVHAIPDIRIDFILEMILGGAEFNRSSIPSPLWCTGNKPPITKSPSMMISRLVAGGNLEMLGRTPGISSCSRSMSKGQ
ncbi:hypothetical protein EYF80_005398 [Liparis tanakae]|uniref:Uncharacterized protein n=1 Tax=Liparis tanakae TaxID=230148 RepID=A0A4Z2J227_9TELE|nr:hypothetical protein EYF80_005398 [Liparis tanakae]